MCSAKYNPISEHWTLKRNHLSKPLTLTTHHPGEHFEPRNSPFCVARSLNRLALKPRFSTPAPPPSPHKARDRRIRQGLKAKLAQRGVYAVAQVLSRVDQSAVKIENKQLQPFDGQIG